MSPDNTWLFYWCLPKSHFFHLVLRRAFPCFRKSSYLRSYHVQSHSMHLPVQFWVQCQNNLGICIRARKPFYSLDSLAIFAVTVVTRASQFCIPLCISVFSLVLWIAVRQWYLIKHVHIQWHIHQIGDKISVIMQKFRSLTSKPKLHFTIFIFNTNFLHILHLTQDHIHTLLRDVQYSSTLAVLSANLG